ncbi:MAG: PLDc N-terminal domain-containing protein [Bacteroidia bacterium]|nr:PLDc N-terminal domain-containing protein [Bacteroidia bacterium]
MFGILGGLYEYYYLVIILQAICVFHSIRKGNQSKWIWIIVFLPFVGSLAYIFTEIVKRQHVTSIQSTVVNMVNPTGRISDLEKQFKYSNTFVNRCALADAYLQNGENERAIELYEPGLTGVFQNNEHVIKQLMVAYYNLGRYQDVVNLAPKVSSTMNFSKTRNNLLYAFALEKTGKTDLVEKEYKNMNHRFSNYEARYNYGCFLLRQNRKEDAGLVFYDVVEEGQQMNRREKGENGIWIDKSKEEWSKLMT